MSLEGKIKIIISLAFFKMVYSAVLTAIPNNVIEELIKKNKENIFCGEIWELK